HRRRCHRRPSFRDARARRRLLGRRRLSARRRRLRPRQVPAALPRLRRLRRPVQAGALAAPGLGDRVGRHRARAPSSGRRRPRRLGRVRAVGRRALALAHRRRRARRRHRRRLRRRRLRRAHLAGRALLGGVALALAIGTRVSYWPLALSFAVVVARFRPVEERRAALAGCFAATLAWLVPFVAVVGARTLFALGRVHLAGHFSDWGGAVTTRPELAARALALLRDLVYDGIWPQPIGLAVALAGCLALAWPWRRPPASARAVAVIVVVPYALWALFAQNVIEQPRHLVPLVAAACVAIGLGAARSPRATIIGFALAALAAAASAPLVLHRGPPAAVVVAERVA